MRPCTASHSVHTPLPTAIPAGVTQEVSDEPAAGTLRLNQALQLPAQTWVIALDPLWDHKKGPELALRGMRQRDRSVIFLD